MGAELFSDENAGYAMWSCWLIAAALVTHRVATSRRRALARASAPPATMAAVAATGSVQDLPTVPGELGRRLHEVDEVLTTVERLEDDLALPAEEQVRLLDLRDSLTRLHRNALLLPQEQTPASTLDALVQEALATAGHLLSGAERLLIDVQRLLLNDLDAQRRYAEAKHQPSSLTLD
jgi:hypothetical protein